MPSKLTCASAERTHMLPDLLSIPTFAKLYVFQYLLFFNEIYLFLARWVFQKLMNKKIASFYSSLMHDYSPGREPGIFTMSISDSSPLQLWLMQSPVLNHSQVYHFLAYFSLWRTVREMGAFLMKGSWNGDAAWWKRCCDYFHGREDQT